MEFMLQIPRGCLRRLVVPALLATVFGLTAWQSAKAQSKIYWHSGGDDTVYRANRNGSDAEVVVGRRLITATGIAVDASSGQVYWSDSGRIASRTQGDEQIVDVIQYDGANEDLALDLTAGKIYWTSSSEDVIRRANLDGSEDEDVVTEGLERPRGIAVDPAGQQVYWTDYVSGDGTINRANYDGSGTELLLTVEGSFIRDIEVDAAGGKMYWADVTDDEISRANLDGSSVETIATGSPSGGIALDIPAGKLYWTEYESGAIEGVIRRANFDGSSVEDLPMQVEGPTDIAIDGTRSTIYVLEAFGTGRKSVQQAGLDGSGQSAFVVRVANIQTHALDVAAGKLYWSHGSGIGRSNLDGTAVEQLDVEGLGSGNRPDELVLDAAGGKLYWTRSDGITRASLDGSGVEPIVVADPPMNNFATNLAIDRASGSMFWVGEGFTPDKIWRATLNGSDVEALFTSLDDPEFIRVDAAQGKIYWVDGFFSTPHIRRSNLDGTAMEDLVTDEDAFGGFVLNPADGKMYWSYRMVQRSNLDGSTVEELLSSTSTGIREHLTIDADEGKMYWTHQDRIERANLDGSEHETIVSGIDSPDGLSLDVATGTSVEEDIAGTRDAYSLEAAFPNPFRTRATFTVMVDRTQRVQIDLFDVLGRQVRVVHDGWLHGDKAYRISVDAADLPNGVYFYRVLGRDFSGTRSVIRVE